jgi:CheY-like chemotaxis protein
MESAVPAADSGPPRRVLIADDNADFVETFGALLRGMGHQVCETRDGEQALAAAPAFRPDVAFLDIGLPVMDGYELARRIRSMPELRGIRLIALTGYGQDSDRARSLAAGFDDHLVKPLRLELLEQILESRGN